MLVGCKSLNQRYGTDTTYYADAKEAPLLKFPRGALLPSTRYDVPHVAKGQIIENPVPPDYEKAEVPYMPDPNNNKA